MFSSCEHKLLFDDFSTQIQFNASFRIVKGEVSYIQVVAF